MGSKRSEAPADPVEEAIEGPSNAEELSDVVADNVKRHRAERNLSLSELAQRSGVSRAMIHQIERRQSAPTINVVWKLATALNLPFAALLEGTVSQGAVVLRHDRRWVLSSSDGRFTSSALFPLDGGTRGAELYELKLLPGADEQAEPHASGTRENIAVAEGELTVLIEDDLHVLKAGDAVLFSADVRHGYQNRSPHPTRAYLMMTYGER